MMVSSYYYAYMLSNLGGILVHTKRKIERKVQLWEQQNIIKIYMCLIIYFGSSIIIIIITII